jgi:ParB-like chromosome segregation protein Spo0J
MNAIGLIQPIVVRSISTEVSDSGYTGIIGLHRFEAARQLNWESIPAIVITDEQTIDEIRLIEIDENLVRADLTPTERAMHHRARQEIYEKLHPESKIGATGRARAKADRFAGSANLSERYTAHASRTTGEGERTIQKNIRRGKKLGGDLLRKVTRTSLDSAEELDALIKLPEDQRAELAERATVGEKVSAMVVTERRIPDPNLLKAVNILSRMPPVDAVMEDIAGIAITSPYRDRLADGLADAFDWLKAFFEAYLNLVGREAKEVIGASQDNVREPKCCAD